MKPRGKDCVGRRKRLSEKWKPIPGHEGYYWISTYGNVKNSEGKLLKWVDCGRGIKKVKLQSQGQKEEKYKSSLMIEVFPEYY